MHSILLVEDEKAMAATLTKGLTTSGYVVTHVATGLEARHINITDYDLVLLDWMLPGFSGIELLRHWRSAKYTTPIIMLSAKFDLRDRVTGLEYGADDYISKIFEWPELIARINSNIRRTQKSQDTAGTIVFDRNNQQFIENDKPIKLTQMEYKVLSYFFDHPSTLITKTSIVRALYNDTHPFSNVVERHIKSIRQKFIYDPITTLRGLGYRLAA
jgi:two-component system, OmpR family, response regulator